MAIKQLTEEQIREWSVEQKDRWWLENVYRGNMPQLTFRAALTGFILGGVLSATNLYIGAKTGWSLGVGITSVILAFALFKVLQAVAIASHCKTLWCKTIWFLSLVIVSVSVGVLAMIAIDANIGTIGMKLGIIIPVPFVWIICGGVAVLLTLAVYDALKVAGEHEFTILENNAMQSIATSAGYMTAPLISSLTAYMIVNQTMLPWWQIISWNVVISILGVLFAFPMKRRFINDEQHPFPEGQAAGVVMDTLHSSDAAVGLFKAKVLGIAAGSAAFIKFLQSESLQHWLQTKVFGVAKEKLWHLHEDLFDLFGVTDKTVPRLRGIDVRQLTISPALDIAMMGAGGLMGIRAGSSLLLGAVLNYIVLAPWMIELGDIKPKADGITFGMRQITIWALWPGVAAMVIASFTAFFSKPDVITSAFRGLTGKKSGTDLLKDIEFPLWISLAGIPVMSLISAWMAHSFFGVPIWATLVGLPLTFILSLVAANSTALTSTTPVGATSKITQLFYGLVRPGDIQSNLATAGITAEVVGNSSNLLMDIKPGYMLGAKPRQQAVGHIIGIFSGAIASTFLFFALFTKGVDPNNPASIENLQSKDFPMPAVTIWKGVAEVLTKGLSQLPSSVVTAVIIASLAALILEIGRIMSKNRLPLSPVAMGLAFVIDFRSSLCMFAGAFLFWLLGVGRVKAVNAPGNLWIENHEPICAGIIAGASLMGILDILVGVFLL